MAKANNVNPSSGNVFQDLGLPAAEEKRTKVQLAVTLNRIIHERGFSQSAAARQLGVNQPKISALVNYRLAGFSVERLLNLLNALGCDIEIVVRKRKPHKTPGIRVTAA